MGKNKLENLILSLKRIQMSEREKKSIKQNVMRFAEMNPTKNHSPYFRLSPYFSSFNFDFVYLSRISVVLLLFVIVGTGSLSIVSAKALPGDLLYPIKINLREKIEENLVFLPEKKIVLRQERIATRFMEVETLIKEDRITPENKSIAESSIQAEKEKLNDDIETINKENPEIAIATKVSIDSSIKQRQEKIDTKIKNIGEIDVLEKELKNASIDINQNLEEDIKKAGDLLDSAILPLPSKETPAKNLTETKKEILEQKDLPQ